MLLVNHAFACMTRHCCRFRRFSRGLSSKALLLLLRTHRVNGVGRGGGQTVFNQILARFHGIRLNPVKVRLKSSQNLLKSCVFRGARLIKIRLSPSDPICVRPHLPGAELRNAHSSFSPFSSKTSLFSAGQSLSKAPCTKSTVFATHSIRAARLQI